MLLEWFLKLKIFVFSSSKKTINLKKSLFFVHGQKTINLKKSLFLVHAQEMINRKKSLFLVHAQKPSTWRSLFFVQAEKMINLKKILFFVRAVWLKFWFESHGIKRQVDFEHHFTKNAYTSAYSAVFNKEANFNKQAGRIFSRNWIKD